MDFINIASPQYIREYLDTNFKGCGRYSSNEEEYIMPSVFVDDDWQRKFSINTNTGLWQDFKAHRQGNFTQFVAQVEKISYKRASSKIMFDNAINEYVAPILKRNEAVTKLEVDTSSWVSIDLYSCYHKNPLIQLAWRVLWERKLFNVEYVEDSPFYFALGGKYKNRIIIPFKKPDETLFYFQARAVLASDYPKYLNPESTQARSSAILYPFKNEEPVLLCEGPLDAISLQLAGINATATMGSSPSKFQMELLKDAECDVVIAYDNDAAGALGADKIEGLRRSLMLPEVKICPPPSRFKDWNEAWQKDFDIKRYVEETTDTYDIEYLVNADIESW